MAKIDVEVVKGVVNGKKKGEVVTIDESSFKNLFENGFVAKKKEAKPKPKKQTPKAKETKKDKE